MKATCWHGIKDVRIDNVPDPEILNPHDAIIEVKKSAICGSDLHLYHGYIPTMKTGDVLGHEFCGEVVAVGSEVKTVKQGDRVVVPFTISCGKCHFCMEGLFALCDNTNPNGALQKKMIGYPTAGLYGYSHGYGGYAGGQAQFVRVPFADTDTLKIPDGLSFEQALFVSDIYPTGYMAADNCNIRPGDTVAIWGCGPVGQFAIKSALVLGAGRVIAIDRWQYRLNMAAQHGATVLNYEEVDVMEALEELTGGLGPNSVIDAVGMEAHGDTIDAVYDEAAQKLRIENDRSHALRQAIKACGKGGTVSIPGVYSGLVDKFPLGVAFAKGLTFKMGQTHMQKYMGHCMELIVEGKIDTTSVISHRISLDDVPQAYDTFAKKEDNAMKFVLTP
jgi:threonine dehydrogenase-like Zn-dependent dehydrogenase